MTGGDRVFTALNAQRTWLGADYRLALIAAAVCVVLMIPMHAVFKPAGIAGLVWGIGAALEKRDRRFLEFLPLRFQLKSRYEAGRSSR